MGRSRIKTSRKDIYFYWYNRYEIIVSWEEALNHCWRCGYEKNTLDRCHIKPECGGGIDHPSNMILLCNACHKEMPDCGNVKIVFEWIQKTGSIFYWHLKTVEEYDRIYGKGAYVRFIRNTFIWLCRKTIPEDIIPELVGSVLKDYLKELGSKELGWHTRGAGLVRSIFFIHWHEIRNRIILKYKQKDYRTDSGGIKQKSASGYVGLIYEASEKGLLEHFIGKAIGDLNE